MGVAWDGGVACRCFPEKRRPLSYTSGESNSGDKLKFKFRRHILNVSSTSSLFKKKSFFGGGGASSWRSLSGSMCISSMDSREKARSAILQSSKHKRVPMFVMMPMDSFGIDATGAPRIRKIKALTMSLKALKLAGVHGIAVEVWWGVVERFSPLTYSWSLYEELFKLIAKSGLKLHVALSFHSNMHLLPGGKGGVSLPLWIQEIGHLNKDIYYRDRNGSSNNDYLTLGVDQLSLFNGRTPLQCYEDFMFNFVDRFGSLFGTLIEEISIGLGPSGELRYPSHPFADGRWNFPGIGEFQCYDKYMMADLKMAACQEGNPQWGDRAPQNAGCYNSHPSGVPFFEGGHGGFLSDYGRFFLEWYSDRLICHADAILARVANMLKAYKESKQTHVMLVAKIGGIYWWYQTVSHPAELTAGYYNTAFRNGYDPLASMLSRHGAALHIPCLEMMDTEMPPTYLCSPEGLLQRIRTVSEQRIIQLIGSNANERFDEAGLEQIYSNCFHPESETVRSFTYFRMNEKIFRGENWSNFVPFVRKMNTDL